MVKDLKNIKQYRVYLTPQIKQGIYGNEINVTSSLDAGTTFDVTNSTINMGLIKKYIDDGDYTAGIQKFSDLSITLFNTKGQFNSETKGSTIFKYSRDLCKVRVEYYDRVSIPYTVFRGLVNEEATRQDFVNDTVNLRVLSEDSILRKVNVPAGTVTGGMTFEGAINAILQLPLISAIMSYNSANINVDLNNTIDNPDSFDLEPADKSLLKLLAVSNSVLTVDSDSVVYVSSRQHRQVTPKYFFHGAYDLQNRENIISIKAFNSGIHRSFNTVKINDTSYSEQIFVDTYNSRRKSSSYDFIEGIVKERVIAARLVREFKVPKEELKLTVETERVKDVELLDLVSINYPKRYETKQDVKLITWSNLKYGGGACVGSKYNKPFGSFSIKDRIGWKVTGIEKSPKNLTTTLRLRKIGLKRGDSTWQRMI